MSYKYKSTFLALTLLLGLGGCNKYLDQTPDPRIQIDTDAKVYKLLENAYPSNLPTILCELSSDNIQHNGFLTSLTITSFIDDIASWRAGESYNYYDEASWIYQYAYRAIGVANLALKSIDELGNGASLAPARGEALVARAYAHFILVTTFCEPYRSSTSSQDLGIPYLRQPVTEFLPKGLRETVAIVYQKIAEDLEEGIPLINDQVYDKSSTKFHFTSRAAKALAARFYLYYNRWDLAERYATEVLGDADPSPMLRDWRNFGNQARSNEDAYALEYTRVDSPANLMLLAVSSNARNYLSRINNSSSRYSHGSRIANRETYRAGNIWGIYAQGEQDPYYLVPFINTNAPYDTSIMPKMPSYKGVSSNTILVPFTTEETLLVRAEARILQGKHDQAIQDINYWTANFINPGSSTNPRRNTWTIQEVETFYSALDYSQGIETTLKKRLHPDFPIEQGEQEALLHHLLQCRRLLTLHEGLRWHDIRRYGIEVVRQIKERDATFTQRDVLSPTDKRRTIQLPSEVISAGMQPNPR